MIKILQKIIKTYSYVVSPLFSRSCRFHPTCSAYAHEALEKHGVLKGLWLSLRRILKCHPWHKCDYVDEVPQEFHGPIDRLRAIGYKHQKSKQ